MYLLISILLLFAAATFVLGAWRRHRIICKIRSMCMEEKCRLLDEFMEPFGYCYIPGQDAFSSTIDSWQKDFGYCTLYDKNAWRFSMIFDALPVFFEYDGRTWRMEFWKGQYGINTGAEAGLYYSDHIVSPDNYDKALFMGADAADMPFINFTLVKNGICLSQMDARHWWLTSFLPGCFSKPCSLTLKAGVTFTECDMADAFANGLLDAGFTPDEFCVCCNTVYFVFSGSPLSHSVSCFKRFIIRIIQWFNRMFCRLYRLITRPFVCTCDRVLFLYYYIPFAFRRLLTMRHYKGIR